MRRQSPQPLYAERKPSGGGPMDIALAVNRRPGRLWAFLQFPLTRIVLAVLALAVVIGAIQVGSKAAGIVPRTAARRARCGADHDRDAGDLRRVRARDRTARCHGAWLPSCAARIRIGFRRRRSAVRADDARALVFRHGRHRSRRRLVRARLSAARRADRRSHRGNPDARRACSASSRRASAAGSRSRSRPRCSARCTRSIRARR